jgi:hypothetical protein
MSQPEESREKTGATDDILLRTDEGAREPDDALRPPDEELPEEERRHSKPQHKLTG